MLTIAFAAALQAASPVAFDFKGIHLGATLAEFRAQPAGVSDQGPMHWACTGEQGTGPWLAPPPPESEVGVSMCSLLEMTSGSWTRGWITLTPEYRAPVEFSFYRDHLYQIAVFPDIQALSTVEAGLVAKFGPPARTEEGTFQVRSGATFPQRILTWSRGSQRIRLEAPALTTEKMQVFYLDTAVAQQIEAAIRARRNPADAM